MGRLFGTDGIRGLANDDLTPELAMAVAVAAAHTLAERDSSHRPVAVVGRDPRASGEMLEAAVVAGLASAGATVVRLGVLPTPAVAYLVGEVRADLGVVLSASHNPMPDNGIKLFGAGGHKLPDDVEAQVEAAVDRPDGWARPTGAQVGRVHDLPDGVQRYVKHLVGSVPHPLDGLRVVVDCANGAASQTAPAAYEQAGAEVVAVAAEPDGLNINDGCGSTHLDGLRAAVLAHRADLGIAHDGDADRCLAVAADGSDVDGDQIMAILASAMHEAGTLTRDTLVATVMSNLGLRLAMREAGITLVETKVGDRYVLEELRRSGLALGGEQSGHVVLPAYATTGDGLLTALHLMARVAATGRPLAELASVLTKLPQVLVNVRVADREAASTAPAVRAAVTEAAAELGESGRVLLRPSGTEPLVRVMVEAATAETARTVAERLAGAVRAASPTA
ncbi:MAG TPA: phosphoglucosamine mutase [Micromonosporaceae bacterium]|nr:phosphoglucosamine mutase [Micromonosporaceae bacterium]